jgi:large subunit ribosomal protein L6
MSYRFGKQGISIPTEVSVKISGQTLTVAGPKGTLAHTFYEDFVLSSFFLGEVSLSEIKGENSVKQDYTNEFWSNGVLRDSLCCPFTVPNRDSFVTKEPEVQENLTKGFRIGYDWPSIDSEAREKMDDFWDIEILTHSNPWEFYYNLSYPVAETYCKYWCKDKFNVNFSDRFAVRMNYITGIPYIWVKTDEELKITSSNLQQPVHRIYTDQHEIVSLEYPWYVSIPMPVPGPGERVRNIVWRETLLYTWPYGIKRERILKQYSYLYRDKVSRKNKTLCSKYALALSRLQNMVTGVSIGFKKILLITGVGYRVQLEDNTLILTLGFSHTIKMDIPNEISVVLEGPTRLIISGTQKASVGQFAAVIRDTCPPEPYKGTGISYEKEIIRRKAGKTGK